MKAMQPDAIQETKLLRAAALEAQRKAALLIEACGETVKLSRRVVDATREGLNHLAITRMNARQIMAKPSQAKPSQAKPSQAKPSMNTYAVSLRG